MKTIATFSNFAEAGFMQSVLQQEGIECFLPDASAVPIGVYEIALQVSDADVAAAQEIVEKYKSENRQKPTEFNHPASGFPFLGIAGFVMILWSVSAFLLVLIFDRSVQGFGGRLGNAFASGIFSLVTGFGVGVFFALLCLIFRPLWKKIKGA